MRISSKFRDLSKLFPGYFKDAKHDHYKDFGFPKDLPFGLLYATFRRNGLAKSAVEQTILKTWETSPVFKQSPEPEQTTDEKSVNEWATGLQLWQKLAEADRRSLVGGYAGVILRFADGEKFSEPAGNVPGGLDGLVEIIPAWAAQLTVSTWYGEGHSKYGQPEMFEFNESTVGGNTVSRQVTIHESRVIIWSSDGTINCPSALEAGYNDLMTMEKVNGAGGEGFWKNAKGAPVIEADAETSLQDMATAMDVPVSEIADKMDEQVADYQKGFDKMLMLQGMSAKTLSVSLPNPEHFYKNPLMSFAASMMIPLKILVGNQTGERASKEDAQAWAKTNKSRRIGTAVPFFTVFIERLVSFGVFPAGKWWAEWDDLTESSMADKIERADKMAGVNQKMGDEVVFHPDEIREAVDLQPLEAGEYDFE